MNTVIDSILRISAFLLGTLFVMRAILSAVRTFILPRAAPDPLTGFVFQSSRAVFNWLAKQARDFNRKDSVLALYAPLTLFLLPAAYLIIVQVGFSGMFWALDGGAYYDAFLLSGSSLLTLGFAQVETIAEMLLAFTEATVGLILIATLIAYLPTIYGAFSTRERAVTMLEVRAGIPPSAITLYERMARLDKLDDLSALWSEWETWFAAVDESHTSLAMLVFFRSPRPQLSWINAAGTVLDAAALYASTLDLPHDHQADLTIRAGYLALHHIADFFRIDYNPEPAPGDPISISREAFDRACDQLERAGVPLRKDRDAAWRNFAGWRVNYDTVLLAIADLIMAPPAVWISGH